MIMNFFSAWKRFKKKYVCINFQQFDTIGALFGVCFLVGYFYSIILGSILATILLIIFLLFLIWIISENKNDFNERLVIRELSRLRRNIRVKKKHLLIKMDKQTFKNIEKEVIKSSTKFDKIKILKTLQRIIYVEANFLQFVCRKINLENMYNHDNYETTTISIFSKCKDTHKYLETMQDVKLYNKEYFMYLKLIVQIAINHHKNN